ncbi:MAG: TIR domain-containing protein [Segetibacter sp.]
MFSPDDVAQMRKTTHSVARDNVIFETGLFMGEYGRDRVFVVQPRDIPDFHILTDLSGFTTVTYEAERAIRKEEVRGAVATAASEIQKGIANSTWSMLKLKIKAKSKLEVAGKIHPLKIEIEINNRHPYPVTLQSMDFQLADGLRFAANSSEEQHKPLFLRIEKDCVHKYKEQITIEKGEQVFSCWIPIDESISEEVLKNAIAAKNTGSWRYRCIWIKEHVIVCNYEVQF